jgi:serine/threonine-protein kinase
MGHGQAEHDEAGPRSRDQGVPGRILFVDDSDEVRRSFRRMLVSAGHSVRMAANGIEATAVVSSEELDLVISDVHMPDMDGVELLKRVHETDPDLPVLLLSGDPDLESALRAVEYGAVEYLAKPVDLEKFQASVQRALEVRRKRVEARDAVARRSGRQARAESTDTNALEGTLLGGCYRIGALLGSGGMGSVYEGTSEDPRAGAMAGGTSEEFAATPVAIKVLHAGISHDADVLRRFRREAHLVAALDHPNIVRVLDFQMPAEGRAFIVMERLHGASLGDAIRRQRPFSIESIAWIALQVLAGLAAAHAAGAIHRDLKPDNVFLTELPGVPDVVKLLDFGVAKLMESPWDERLTQTGVVMGTPGYMAPEQARGESADARSDLYAVGCLIFEALTGRPPFVANNYNAVMFQINQSAPPSLAELRPDLDGHFCAIVKKALEKELDARFQSASAFAEALAPWAGQGTTSSPSREESLPAPATSTIRPPVAVREQSDDRRSKAR